MILDRDCLTILKKIISKKLDEQDAISLHAKPTNFDEDSGSNRVNNNGATDTQAQNNRDTDPGSAVRGTLQ